MSEERVTWKEFKDELDSMLIADGEKVFYITDGYWHSSVTFVAAMKALTKNKFFKLTPDGPRIKAQRFENLMDTFK